MLDDLKLIHSRDAEDALGVVEKQWRQLVYSYEIDMGRFRPVDNVVLAGMGGSVLPGVFVQVWPGTAVPFEIVRDYSLPAYVARNTLVIVSSYSGNTEEALAALQDAESRQAQIVVITAGGKLKDIANDRQYPICSIPGGIQPRMSSFYILTALVLVLESIGLVRQGSGDELKQASDWLAIQVSSWRPDVAVAKNPAKQLALELVGKSVVVYSGPALFPAANKWKICLNENAKNIAWVNQYPEFNHNEFIGWTGQPVDKPYAVIEIRSSLEHPQMRKRFESSERLLSGKRPAPHVVRPEGDTVLKQLLWTANLGDFISLYVALLNGLDPTPVDLTERLKASITD